jgi:hypothetical protein
MIYVEGPVKFGTETGPLGTISYIPETGKWHAQVEGDILGISAAYNNAYEALYGLIDAVRYRMVNRVAIKQHEVQALKDEVERLDKYVITLSEQVKDLLPCLECQP